ncbi:hypothetical protein BKA81DRAFT_410908 [Phyllosticta paracitricarpa]|uniref:F-box domain-containing protein n=1 Tax=Phyllosticta citricarpa TaxID=55181 RepID=A0ABR1M6T6_9PEZI
MSKTCASSTILWTAVYTNQPQVPRVAILPRLGGASAHFHVPEDALLRQLLCACSNLNVLHLKIFGDILPVIQIPGGFPDLRKLFLRFLGHGYGQSTSNSVENSCDTSMKDLMWLLKFPRLHAASAFDVGLTITATDGASIVKKNPREPFSSLTNDCLRLVLFFVQERHVIPSSSVLPNPFVKTPNPLPMDTMAAQGSHIRVSTSVWAADQGEGSLDLPTELVRPIAAELPANDIARSSASCRKVYQDVKPVISGSIPTVMHSMDPKLSLLARSCRKE